MEPLVRYTIPTRYDEAEYGQLCIVKGEDSSQDMYYIQITKDPDAYTWVPMGEFLEKAFEDKLLAEAFVEDCLKLYFR